MTRFKILPERSTATIEGSTNVHPVHAEAQGLEGTIEVATDGAGALDLSHTPTARLELQIDRIRSSNALFERELRRRVEARKFPSIVGELRTARVIDGGRYALDGEMTFHGVARSVSGEVTVGSPDADTITVEGERVFDIRDFGLEAPRMIVLKADPEVTVRVQIVAQREG